MQLVTDRAADLTPAQIEGLDIHIMPLTITLDGISYTSGIDLQPAEFYALLEKTGSFPVTSQPSAGEFAELYRRLAQNDPDILSIHVASGLSGTINAARAGAAMVPEANITIFDSLTLSCPLGWMVEAAGRAIQQGWEKDRILNQLRKIHEHTQGLFTLSNLQYLIHGGRISHMKGLVASVLNIKPIIGPDKDTGAYHLFAQEFSMSRALNRIPEIVAKLLPEKRLRVQLLHGQNPQAVETLRKAMDRKFECLFEPDAVIAPVLGAHTGPSVVGLAVGDPEAFGGLM
jgi:fatty acid kinase fatty acid binding subunit